MNENNVEIRLYDIGAHQVLYPKLKLDMIPDKGDTIRTNEDRYYQVIHKKLQLDAYTNGHSLTVYLKEIDEDQFYRLINTRLPLWKRLFR